MFPRIIAALSFFTRLPFWRLCNVPAKCYEKVVPLWPLAGWLTGAVMAGVFLLAIRILPANISIILAITARILLTGALHEDGFADFCDGFGGGGTSRERTLTIMKDSHIGTYGVLGLIIYFLLFFLVLTSIYDVVEHLAVSRSLSIATNVFIASLFVIVDSAVKGISSAIVWFLPYARTAETAKNRLVYSHVSIFEKLMTIVIAALPFVLFCEEDFVPVVLCAFFASATVFGMLIIWMRKRIGGYTGDCCGAMFIITELVAYITIAAMLNYLSTAELLTDIPL